MLFSAIPRKGVTGGDGGGFIGENYLILFGDLRRARTPSEMIEFPFAHF
jgi:hypothetical protein